MPAFNLDDFMARLETSRAPADIDAVFNGLSALKPQTRTRAINAIERSLVADLRQAFNEISLPELRADLEIARLQQNSPLGGILGLIGDLLGEPPIPAETGVANDLKIGAQMVLNVNTLKGDKADPLVKQFAAEAAKLTDKEYNSDYGQMTLMLRMAEKVQAEAKAAAAAPAPKPAANPFRK